MNFEIDKPIPESLMVIMREELTSKQRLACLQDGRSKATLHSLFSRRGNITFGNLKTVENLHRLTLQLIEYKLRKLKSL